MLVQCRRQWANIETASGECHVFDGRDVHPATLAHIEPTFSQCIVFAEIGPILWLNILAIFSLFALTSTCFCNIYVHKK